MLLEYLSHQSDYGGNTVCLSAVKLTCTGCRSISGHTNLHWLKVYQHIRTRHIRLRSSPIRFHSACGIGQGDKSGYERRLDLYRPLSVGTHPTRQNIFKEQSCIFIKAHYLVGYIMVLYMALMYSLTSKS
jgi:hypothetical protein